MTMKALRVFYKLVFIVAVSINFSKLHAIEKLNVATGEWAPYISETLPSYGSVSKIVNLIFENANVELQYGFFPWSRAYEEAKKGNDWQITTAWVKNSEREIDFYFSVPIYEIKSVVFHIRDSGFEWSEPRDLTNYIIGATQGYSYGPIFARGEKQGWLKVDRVSKEILNFRKLLRGRVDGAVSALDVGEELIRQNFSAAERYAFTYHPKPIQVTNLHIMVSKNAPEARKILELINRSINELREAGLIS